MLQFKIKKFYEPQDVEIRDQSENPEGGSETGEVLEQTNQSLEELTHYVLDSKRIQSDTKLLIESSLLNDEKNGFDSSKINEYLRNNGDKTDSVTTIIAWQYLLKEKGLYTGKIDGIRGPLTNQAIDAFKTNNHLSDNDNFNEKLIESNTVEYVKGNAEERLKGVEQKYASLDSSLDFDSTPCYAGLMKNGEEGCFHFAEETYKEVKAEDGSYEGLGFETGTTSKGNKYLKVGQYKNGKLNGTGIIIYDHGGKTISDFKDGEESGYCHRIYSETNEYYKEYFGQVEGGKLNGTGKITKKDGSIYEGEWKNDFMEGKGKLTMPNGEVREGEFIGGTLKEGYQTNIQKETITDDNGAAIYTETVGENKLYEGINHQDGKIDESWLKSHQSQLSNENSYSTLLWGKTYEADGSYEKITVGGNRQRFNTATYRTEMDRTGKGMRVVKEKMDKDGQNGMVVVESWGKKIPIKCVSGNYTFITPDPNAGGEFELGSFSSLDDAVLAADLINFAIHGTKTRLDGHSDESFDQFETDGSGIDLDLHKKSSDITWIYSHADKYFGGASQKSIVSWMNKYYWSQRHNKLENYLF